MALTIEDGTGKPDADSYLDVGTAVARLALWGYAKLAALEPVDAEAALRLSTSALDDAFRANPRGFTRNEDQALAFPRCGVKLRGKATTSNEVPELVLELCTVGAELQAYRLANAAAGVEPQDPAIKRLRRASRAEAEYFRGAASTTEAQRQLSALRKRLISELVDEGRLASTWGTL